MPTPDPRFESKFRGKLPGPRQDYSKNQPNPIGRRAHFANAQSPRLVGLFAKAQGRRCFLPLDTWVGFLALVRRPRWHRQRGLFAASHFPTGNRPLHSEGRLGRPVDSERWLRRSYHSDPARFPGYSERRDNEPGWIMLSRKLPWRSVTRPFLAMRFPSHNAPRHHWDFR